MLASARTQPWPKNTPRDGSRNMASRLRDWTTTSGALNCAAAKKFFSTPRIKLPMPACQRTETASCATATPERKPASLIVFPKHDVVNHFQSQAAMRAAGLVDGAFDHLKGADTDISARTRIAHLVRVDGHHKREAEEGEEHFFPETNHDDIAEEREMVEL